MSAHNPVSSLPLPGYFSHLAKGYNRNTANTTLDIFADVLKNEIQTSRNPINSSSIVHDNAAGPGIATAGILETLDKADVPKEILISDNNDVMVTGARESFDLPAVQSKNLDAHDLSSLEDSTFTHSITNFSIFTFQNPEAAMAEVFRTLKPDGVAVVTSWERFAILPLVHETQKALRPDLPLMPVPGPRFFEDGELEKVLATAGFQTGNMKSLKRDITVSNEDGIAGLKEFMKGPFMARAKENYTPEDLAKWSETIDTVVENEIATNGGVQFKAFIVIASK